MSENVLTLSDKRNPVGAPEFVGEALVQVAKRSVQFLLVVFLLVVRVEAAECYKVADCGNLLGGVLIRIRRA